MSYDLMVFDPNVPPPDRAGFMAWYGEQVRWEKDYDYNNPANCSPSLAAWFADMRRQFPALNGPFADLSKDDSKVADYSVGKSFIYAGFAWSEATNAHQVAFELAKKHGIGFFNVSEKDGEAWAPQPGGGYCCIHGTGAAFASNPEVRVISIAKVQVIKKR
jgi:hypothetical protein